MIASRQFFKALVTLSLASGGFLCVPPVFAGHVEPGALKDCVGVWINPTNYAGAWLGAAAEDQLSISSTVYSWVTEKFAEQGIPLVDQQVAESDPRYAVVSFVGGRSFAEAPGVCAAFSVQVEIRRRGTLSSQPERPIWAIIYTDGRTGFASNWSGQITGQDAYSASLFAAWLGVIEDLGVEWKQQHAGGQ